MVKYHLKEKFAMREAVVYQGEDGFWVAECPSLPGCVSQGTTREEAVINIKEAISAYINALKDDNIPVPKGKGHVTVVAV